MVDIFIFALPANFLVGVAAPGAFVGPGAEQLLGMLLLFVWAFVEAFFISSIGTTPGKWLFRVKITATGATAISYPAALTRSISVWWRGLGTGFPIVTLFTLAQAHSGLKRDLTTTWDRDGGFVVTHGEVGTVRVAVAVVFFLLFVVLAAVSRANLLR